MEYQVGQLTMHRRGNASRFNFLLTESLWAMALRINLGLMFRLQAGLKTPGMATPSPSLRCRGESMKRGSMHFMIAEQE